MNFENWFTYIYNPARLLAQLHWNVSSVFTASTCPIIWTSKCGIQDTRIAARLFSRHIMPHFTMERVHRGWIRNF